MKLHRNAALSWHGRRRLAERVVSEGWTLVVEIALDGVQSSTRYPGGVALRFARVKRYRPDKDAGEADTIDDLRALLPARAGDEFHASTPSKDVLNQEDEHPEEER
jgi:ATP-dependent DNA ligase